MFGCREVCHPGLSPKTKVSADPRRPLQSEAGELQWEASQFNAPVVARIVIPAFKASRTIRSVVEAVLQSQDAPHFEIVVVDDGGNDDLPKTLFGAPVEIVCTGGSGSAAVARNRGSLGFGGRFLVFIDADVVVDSLCLKRLLQPLQDGQAEATVGNYSKDVVGMSFASRYKQLYISRIYQRQSGYLRNDFWTAVSAMDAAVFNQLNGFDTHFRGAAGEDEELGIRLTRTGSRIQAVPEALGHHRNSLSVPNLLRNDWRKGRIAMDNYLHRDKSISDNRHATRRDMLAVACATAVGIAALALVLGRSPSLTLAAGTLALGYILTRIDILRVFASQGIWFVVRAAGLMFLLDLVRATCVAAGLAPRPLRSAAKAAAPSRHANTGASVHHTKNRAARWSLPTWLHLP